MTTLERNTLSVVIVLSVLWAGGLVVVYALRSPPTVSMADYESAPPARAVTASASKASPSPSSTLRESLPPVAAPDSTTEQRRARMLAFWGQDADRQLIARPPLAVLSADPGRVLPDAAPPGTAGAGRRVRLHLKDATVRQTLAALGKVAGVRFLLASPADLRLTQYPAVTIDVDDTPLAEVVARAQSMLGLRPLSALDNIARDYGIESVLSASPERPIVFLTQREAGSGPGVRVTSGSFAFELTDLTHTVSLDPAAAALGGSLRCQINVQAEPALNVLSRAEPVRLNEAADEAGHTLLPTTNSASYENGWQPMGRTLSLSLKTSADVGRSIAKLKGVVTFAVAAKEQVVDFATDATPATKGVGALRVSVARSTNFRSQSSQWEIKFERGTMSVEDWRRFLPAIGSLRPTVYDDKGHVMPPPRVYQTGSSLAAASVLVNLDDTRNRTSPRTLGKLSIRVPTEIKTVDVPVEWTDLPLP